MDSPIKIKLFSYFNTISCLNSEQKQNHSFYTTIKLSYVYSNTTYISRIFDQAKIKKTPCIVHTITKIFARNMVAFDKIVTRAENRRRIRCGHCADIYPRRYMSELCPHNVCTMSAQHLVRHISFVRCCADIVRTYICISPGIYVRTISFFGFQLRKSSSNKLR